MQWALLRHTLFYYVLFYCPSSKSVSNVFLTAFAYFGSLCHILVILAIFQTFSVFSLWWFVVSDLCCYCHKVIRTPCRFRWWLASFSNKVFLKYAIFFRHNTIYCTPNRLPYSQNLTLYALGEKNDTWFQYLLFCSSLGPDP